MKNRTYDDLFLELYELGKTHGAVCTLCLVPDDIRDQMGRDLETKLEEIKREIAGHVNIEEETK